MSQQYLIDMQIQFSQNILMFSNQKCLLCLNYSGGKKDKITSRIWWECSSLIMFFTSVEIYLIMSALVFGVYIITRFKLCRVSKVNYFMNYIWFIKYYQIIFITPYYIWKTTTSKEFEIQQNFDQLYTTIVKRSAWLAC